MLRGNGRFCDGCGQRLPAGSKLSREVLPKAEAALLNPDAPENPDGSVTLDFCLQCRIARAGRRKRVERRE